MRFHSRFLTTMVPKIYSSPFSPVPVSDRSIFTHLFNTSRDPTDVGGFPGSHPALIDASSGTTLTRAQLKNLALSFGHGITHHPHIRARRGDTIMIYSQNSVAWPVVLFGAVAAGLRCTLANNAYNSRELRHQYVDSGAKAIFSSEDGVATSREMLKDLGLNAHEADKRIVVMSNCLAWAGGPSIPLRSGLSGLLRVSDLLNFGALKEEEKFDGKLAQETAYLCYSSGTTGRPKGVESTHRNITSVIDQVRPGLPDLSPRDTLIGVLPFYHIYGAIKLLHFPFLCGTPVVVMSRFDPVQFCANIEKYKVTVSFIVPPVLVVLARHPAVDQYDLSWIRLIFSGAAPLGAALSKQVMQRLSSKRKGKGSVDILQGYGLTETSPTVTLMSSADGLRKLGSVGLLLPNLEARLVVDTDGLVDAKEGESGELWIKGPSVMKGYLNNPKATEEAITLDKWFKTGDIAIRDKEGFYWIVDRRKELIKYKGSQVPPAELESVLLTHPDIADVAVIGVESAKQATELPRAYIVHARPDALKTDAEKVAFADYIQKWIQGKVARHMLLRGGVVVIDTVPKSAAGKILRRELRDRAKEELKGRDPWDDGIPEHKL